MPRNWTLGQFGALRLGNMFWPVWLAASSLTLGMLFGNVMQILFPENAVAVFQIIWKWLYETELPDIDRHLEILCNIMKCTGNPPVRMWSWLNFVVSDQSGCIKITARGSASQGKNDTVFLDKLVVGNTYMLMNLEWARELMAIINSNTSIVHLLRQCIITAELLVLATIRIS